MVPHQIARKELQSDKSAEDEILSLVHHTHPASTEFFQHPIVRDRCSVTGFNSGMLDTVPI